MPPSLRKGRVAPLPPGKKSFSKTAKAINLKFGTLPRVFSVDLLAFFFGRQVKLVWEAILEAFCLHGQTNFTRCEIYFQVLKLKFHACNFERYLYT